jgi:glycosyltransferase involved in cell wall biosynthesis
MSDSKPKISVVTPTFLRPSETLALLENLSRQTLLPFEVILVDGAPPEQKETEKAVAEVSGKFPFNIKYARQSGGTAIQRNVGIDLARGNFIALVDDDVRLDADFFKIIADVFNSAGAEKVGGVVGYRKSGHFSLESSTRWKWYKRLRLLKIFEPGRYDFSCGYPINNYLQPPFRGVRTVDFMTTACAVWRREVFAEGLRFHSFFRDYGVLEDAHFALRAGRKWELLQSGDALCEELYSPNGRENRRRIGYKCVVNYYFVFQDIMSPLSIGQKFRFWRYQSFEFLRIAASALLRRRKADFQELAGRAEGVLAILRGAAHFKN